MAEFVEAAVSFPAVVWTVALAVSVGYWLLSTALIGDSDVEVDAEGGGFSGGVADALGLGHAPISIVVTVLSAIGWLVTMLAVSVAGSTSTVVGVGLLIASLLVAGSVTGRVSRLLGPLFAENQGIDRDHLIGRTCTVRTGRVDTEFGQAEVIDGDGAAHVIQARCLEANELTAGSKALVVDVQDGVFVIDPDLSWAGDD
ncbi:MAG: hypothetical protein AAF962_11350 [Actinomycetota bacterium]